MSNLLRFLHFFVYFLQTDPQHVPTYIIFLDIILDWVGEIKALSLFSFKRVKCLSMKNFIKPPEA